MVASVFLQGTRISRTYTVLEKDNLVLIQRAKPATKREMSQFHTDEYVEFLYRVTPNLVSNYGKEVNKYNIGDDCPLFDGLFDYCSISAGGSMEGAARLSRDKCDIAVNWAGGLHHAKKCEASGFCYVNDIVLGILELLRYHQRVLYIDIDVHHGDGVEEAFLTTDRVMTCSFHKYGEFFPGTGDISDVGVGKGKYYAVNFPLRDGITDDNYKTVFEPTITRIMEMYAPGAVVLQCGSDSLAGDRIGPFNLSMHGHANCVKFVKSFGLPTLMVGGGGYTIRNVSRTWAYETGIAAGMEMSPNIPVSEYYEYFGPDYQLDVLANNMPNRNSPGSLQRTKEIVFRHLAELPPVPSVQMHHAPDRFHLNADGEEVSLEEQDQINKEMAEDRAAAQGRRQARRPLIHDDTEGHRPLDESDDEDDMRGDPGRRNRTDLVPPAAQTTESAAGPAAPSAEPQPEPAAPAAPAAAVTTAAPAAPAAAATTAAPAAPAATAATATPATPAEPQQPAPAPAPAAPTAQPAEPPVPPQAPSTETSAPPEPTPVKPSIPSAPLVAQAPAAPEAQPTASATTQSAAQPSATSNGAPEVPQSNGNAALAVFDDDVTMEDA